MTGDVGEETKFVLFFLILAANLIFVVLWIMAYLSTAEWAEPYVKYARLETKYIVEAPIEPYFPKNEFKTNLV